MVSRYWSASCTITSILSPRCLLPLRSGQIKAVPKPAGRSPSILSESHGGSGSVPQPAPYLVLGNGYREPCTVGYCRLIRLLEETAGRGNSAFLPIPRLCFSLNDSQWSKAAYAYGTAVCLLEVGGEKNKEEARKLLRQIPDLRQRIAGKSIPLEVTY